MKNINLRYSLLMVLSALLFIAGCAFEESKEEAEKENETRYNISNDVDPQLLTWYSVWDSVSGKMEFRRGSKLDSIRKTPENLVEVLNKYEQINISLLSVHGDTAKIEVNNPQVLTEQSGTAGAREYMGMVVYTLTEAEGINKVDLVFEEGSHAVPGVYSRAFFRKE